MEKCLFAQKRQKYFADKIRSGEMSPGEFPQVHI
jgi:hypothetical protein